MDHGWYIHGILTPSNHVDANQVYTYLLYGMRCILRGDNNTVSHIKRPGLANHHLLGRLHFPCRLHVYATLISRRFEP